MEFIHSFRHLNKFIYIHLFFLVTFQILLNQCSLDNSFLMVNQKLDINVSLFA